ncbi:MAG: 2-dehydropantoate 2-reductase, partial [Chloroflexi bacterium]
MGCLFGARLTPHADVTLIGRWPEQIAALQRGPLRLLSGGGDESIALCVTDDIESVDPVDVALVVTKTQKTAAAGEGAARILKPDGLAITLQNGVGNLEILAGLLGDDRVALGV